MKFPEAATASGLAEHLHPGLKAVRNQDRARIKGGRGLNGSVDLDDALKADLPAEHRWDYLIGRALDSRSDHLHCVEVHRADVGEVAAMIGKKAALDAFLAEKALGKLSKSCHWISTDGGVHLPKNAPAARRLALAGIEYPRRVLDLN